jgi:hypothetical protein
MSSRTFKRFVVCYFRIGVGQSEHDWMAQPWRLPSLVSPSPPLLKPREDIRPLHRRFQVGELERFSSILSAWTQPDRPALKLMCPRLSKTSA